MYTQNDRRIRKTRRAIRESYAALCADKDPDRITVQELAEHADISRGTFYLYYRDIRDLRGKLQEEIFDEFMAYIYETGKPNELDEPYPYLRSALDYLSENRISCQLILNSDSREAFSEMMSRGLENSAAEQWLEPMRFEYDSYMLRYYSRFAMWGFLAAAIDWLQEERPRTSREMADMLGQIMDYGLDALRHV